jgi:hypothetical protein
MDTFPPAYDFVCDIVQLMKTIGNGNANKFWQWSLQGGNDAVDTDSDM